MFGKVNCLLTNVFFFGGQIHGWPDLSMGWRYQIPHLVELGFRVVAPDMMGYGGTVRIFLNLFSLGIEQLGCGFVCV